MDTKTWIPYISFVHKYIYARIEINELIEDYKIVSIYSDDFIQYISYHTIYVRIQLYYYTTSLMISLVNLEGNQTTQYLRHAIGDQFSGG